MRDMSNISRILPCFSLFLFIYLSQQPPVQQNHPEDLEYLMPWSQMAQSICKAKCSGSSNQFCIFFLYILKVGTLLKSAYDTTQSERDFHRNQSTVFNSHNAPSDKEQER